MQNANIALPQITIATATIISTPRPSKILGEMLAVNREACRIAAKLQGSKGN